MVTKVDRASGMEAVRKNASEQYQDFVRAIRDASRVKIETPNALDVDVSCFPADTLRALLTRAEDAERASRYETDVAQQALEDRKVWKSRAEQAEAKLADVWDEAIEAAADAADIAGDFRAADDIRTIPNPYRKDKTDE